MFHPYVISLDNDKYRVINDNGILTFLRYGAAWPSAQESLAFSKVVLAMAQRIEELEVAIGEVLGGTMQANGQRATDGMKYAAMMGKPVGHWQERLQRVLEQK
jgi:hypothetical protein